MGRSGDRSVGSAYTAHAGLSWAAPLYPGPSLTFAVSVTKVLDAHRRAPSPVPQTFGGTVHEQVRDEALAWLRADGPATAGGLVGCLDLEGTWTVRELYELALDDMQRANDTRQGPGLGTGPQRSRTLLGLT